MFDRSGGGIDRCLDSIAVGTLRDRVVVVVGSIAEGRLRQRVWGDVRSILMGMVWVRSIILLVYRTNGTKNRSTAEANKVLKAQPNRPILLYRHVISGHAHRVELFLSLLGLPFESIDVDLAAGEHKQPEFLKINPFGQVPTIDDDGVTISDSNAILIYLATKYADASWLPTESTGAANVQQWLSVAAGQIAQGPAAARLINIFGKKLGKDRAQEIADNLFKLIETHLSAQQFLVGNAPTIADISGYAYIAHAPEGDISLQPYPQIQAWLTRIEQLPGFVPMVDTKVGLAA